MKRLILYFVLLLITINGYSQNKIVCNFNYISSNYNSWGNVSINVQSSTDGSLGKTGLISVPANNEGDGVYFNLNNPFTKSVYSGIKLRVKSSNMGTFSFVYKLENTLTGASSSDWETYPKYNANGQWQEVILPMDKLQDGQFNRITLVPAAYEYKSAFSFYIDEIALVDKNVNSSSPTITISGNKFYAYNKQIFFNGINTAWQWNNDYRLDFLGRNYNQEWWQQEFTRYEQNNINLARIWIHGGGNTSPSLNGDGVVTGVTNQFWTDMDKLVALSKERQIYIMPTFWSFDMVINNYNATRWSQFRQIINDENKTKWYCEYFLVPFVKRYNNEPYIMGYDICNEIEHMWRDGNCGNLSRNNVMRFIAICASYIHKHTNKPVTSGSMWIICNSSKYSSWTWADTYAGNNYSETSLRARYNDADAYLDFYSPHWYQWQSSGAFFNTTIGEWMDDGYKPVVIGETPGYNVNESGWNMTLANAYLNAYWNGYSGVCAWKSPWENDGYGTFAGITPATNNFYQNYPQLVYPNGKRQTFMATDFSITDNQLEKESATVSDIDISIVNEYTLRVSIENNYNNATIQIVDVSTSRIISTQKIRNQYSEFDLHNVGNNKIIAVKIVRGGDTVSKKFYVR
ncbi:hypothetical protein [Dysgonomonas sp. BGC7]|uniref:hypothetical protein n=1 Tax=Dysgonomonas sp. BGC7 TaxID=1658008 RepID=UPI0006803FB8|nr:hypothetical protein [Dysgonomonas sp. BGC7]MBD8388547.1 hypothetical protein [Dysgonomonas sp. BGC7]